MWNSGARNGNLDLSGSGNLDQSGSDSECEEADCGDEEFNNVIHYNDVANYDDVDYDEIYDEYGDYHGEIPDENRSRTTSTGYYAGFNPPQTSSPMPGLDAPPTISLERQDSDGSGMDSYQFAALAG